MGWFEVLAWSCLGSLSEEMRVPCQQFLELLGDAMARISTGMHDRTEINGGVSGDYTSFTCQAHITSLLFDFEADMETLDYSSLLH